MSKMFGFLLLLSGLAMTIYSQGNWDLKSIWARNPMGEYDSRYTEGGVRSPTVYFDSSIVFSNGQRNVTLSWRLSYFPNKLPSPRPHLDSLPLIVGLHSWQDGGATIPTMLGGEPSKIQYEGSFEDLIFLSVALENFNNLGTWWWGTMIDGVPQPWAENAIIALIKNRLSDACAILASHGANDLAGKRIDINRVYLQGHSMGGTGTYRMGIKHPEIFAAIHAHAGFARFKEPCGAFCSMFTDGMVGTSQQNLKTPGLDGLQYNAVDYTDMAWFVGIHRGKSWENAFSSLGKKYDPPYFIMSHGKNDGSVPNNSADTLQRTAEANRFGYTYFRFSGGHSDQNFTRWNWMTNFRKNQSYLAFGNNSTNSAGNHDYYNFLDRIGWYPGTIIDSTNMYSVTLNGTGTVSVTPRRLQKFTVHPGDSVVYWVGSSQKSGKVLVVDSLGLITVPSVIVNGDTKLIISKTDIPVNAIRTSLSNGTNGLTIQCNFNRTLSITGIPEGTPCKLIIYTLQGRCLYRTSIVKGRAVFTLDLMAAKISQAGNYIISVQNQKGVIKKKVMVNAF
jgi:pimeloyl-ACP methyl ester carboxylesterase